MASNREPSNKEINQWLNEQPTPVASLFYQAEPLKTSLMMAQCHTIRFSNALREKQLGEMFDPSDPKNAELVRQIGHEELDRLQHEVEEYAKPGVGFNLEIKRDENGLLKGFEINRSE